MKCNELMVGDWIADKHGFPMQVTTVGNDYLYADFEDNEGDVFEFDDKDSKPYPILLTDEFFKRNNFDKKILHWTKGSSIREKQESGGYVIAIKVFHSSMGLNATVYCVHELQQILRLAGYTGLAKIVKL